MNITTVISVKEITLGHYNFYINGKFYIGTVQQIDDRESTWIAQLLWDEGGTYTYTGKSMDECVKKLHSWIEGGQ